MIAVTNAHDRINALPALRDRLTRGVIRVIQLLPYRPPLLIRKTIRLLHHGQRCYIFFLFFTTYSGGRRA